MSKRSTSAGSKEKRRPRGRERRFVEEYAQDPVGTRAAVRAGYSARSAKQQAHKLLRRPHVQEAIAARMDELSMPAAEAVLRLSRIAQGAISEVIAIEEDGRWSLDLKKADESGAISLIQELSYDRQGRPKVKLYSAHEALRDIAKIRGLFVDRIAGDDGGPLKIEIVRE